MSFPHPDRLQRMIAEAMKNNAPRMHANLLAEGKLQDVVAQRAKAAQEQYEQAMSELGPKETKAIVAAQQAGYLQTVQAWNQRESRIAEEVLVQAFAFLPASERVGARERTPR